MSGPERSTCANCGKPIRNEGDGWWHQNTGYVACYRFPGGPVATPVPSTEETPKP